MNKTFKLRLHVDCLALGGYLFIPYSSSIYQVLVYTYFKAGAIYEKSMYGRSFFVLLFFEYSLRRSVG